MKRALYDKVVPGNTEVTTTSIPDDIWSTVCSFLRMDDLLQFSVTSKHFRQLALDSIKVMPPKSHEEVSLCGNFLRLLNNVRDLFIYRSLLSDDDVKHLTRLEKLFLIYRSEITNECIQKMTRLTSLTLHHNTAITKEGISHITSLVNFDICDSRINVCDIENKYNVMSLSIDSDELLDDKILAKMTRLSSFEVYNNSYITGESLVRMSFLSSLTLLGIKTRVCDEFLVTRSNTLTTLNISENECITDYALQQLTNLTNLDLSYNEKITDQGIRNLTMIKRLVLAHNDDITDYGISQMLLMENLNINNCRHITEHCIMTMTNIKKLKMYNIPPISDMVILHLTQLTHLNIGSGNDIITNNGISHLTNMRTLHLDNNKLITDEGIQKMTRIKKLSLCWNSKITNNGLRDMKDIEVLRIVGNSDITVQPRGAFIKRHY